MLRYYAARCLIRAGDPAGVALLIDLLEIDPWEFDGMDAAEIEAVREAARKLLAHVSGIKATEVGAWQDWAASLDTLSKVALPAPAGVAPAAPR